MNTESVAETSDAAGVREDRKKKKKIRDLLTNEHKDKAPFPSREEVQLYGLDPEDYLNLLRQMEKSREIAFEVDGENTLDEAPDDTFFDSGVQGVRLVKGSIDVAYAAGQRGPNDEQQPCFSGQADAAEEAAKKENAAKKYHVNNYIGKFSEGSDREVPPDSILQQLETSERALQCYQRITANNLPETYYTALPVSWLIHFKITSEQYKEEVATYLLQKRRSSQRQSISVTTPLETEVVEKDQERPSEMAASEADSFVFRSEINPQPKALRMDVVLEEGVQEEREQLQQAWEDLKEAKAQLQLQRMEFAHLKATEEYDFNEKHREQVLRDDNLRRETLNLKEQNTEYQKNVAELEKGQNELKTQRALDKLKQQSVAMREQLKKTAQEAEGDQRGLEPRVMLAKPRERKDSWKSANSLARDMRTEELETQMRQMRADVGQLQVSLRDSDKTVTSMFGDLSTQIVNLSAEAKRMWQVRTGQSVPNQSTSAAPQQLPRQPIVPPVQPQAPLTVPGAGGGGPLYVPSSPVHEMM